MLVACLASLVWAIGWIGIHPHDFAWYPIVLYVASIPFLRSRSVLAFIGLLFAGSTAVASAVGKDSDEEWPVYLALSVVGALARGLGLWLSQKESTTHMGLQALRLGRLFTLIPVFILSFHRGMGGDYRDKLWVSEGWWWVVLFGLVGIAAVMSWIAALGAVGRTANEGPGDGGVDVVTLHRCKHLLMLLAALIVIVGLTSGHNYSFRSQPTLFC